jgi:hypothetical protein
MLQFGQIAKYKPNGLSGDSDLAKDHLDGGHFHDPHSRSGGPQRDTLMSIPVLLSNFPETRLCMLVA